MMPRVMSRCSFTAAVRIEIEKYEKCGGPVLIVVVRFKKVGERP